MDPQDLDQLRHLTRNFIIRMTSFGFSTKDEVLKWRDNQEAALQPSWQAELNGGFKR